MSGPAAAVTPSTSDGRRVDVRLGDRGYPVHIGAGVRHLLPGIVAGTGASRAAVVTRRGAEVPELDVDTLTLTLDDAEARKCLAAVEALCTSFAEFGITRADVVVSCGGGVTTDTVGLAAALYHRGVPVVHLPTSLLAQVDASVGGKTAVNLPVGKNLVGAFWQPRAVLCDVDALATLPPREWRNGLGEIARCHFIGAGDLRGLPLVEQITRSVARKAELVAADEHDTGVRVLLNYGHTLGHALELVTGFAVRHGEGVAVGTVFAGLLAYALGRVDEARAAEHRAVVADFDLPTGLPLDIDIDALMEAMRRDKKVLTAGLSFVLDGPAGAELVTGVPEYLVLRTLREMPRSEW